MTSKILFVDDEENILEAFRRQMRGLFPLQTANGGLQAIEILMTEGPFAITVADLRMPGMDGIEYLSKAREIAPDTVRIMLTGHADSNTAIHAVNEGQIFRFLTKPCPSDTLFKTLTIALEQYRLVTAERELLEKTLKRSVRLLTEMLSLSNPQAFNHTLRLRRIAKNIVVEMHIREGWLYELAAMLSQIGCIALPNKVLEKLSRQMPLTQVEENMVASHPLIGARLLENIPRLEEVAEIVKNQLRPFCEYEREMDIPRHIKLGAQIMKVCLGYDHLIQAGSTHKQAIEALLSKEDSYNPQIVRSLGNEEILHECWGVKLVNVEALDTWMILDEDIYAHSGEKLIPKKQEVTLPILERLKLEIKRNSVIEPIRVLVPHIIVQDEVQ
jgi:CheY-like chemotaxis protein